MAALNQTVDFDTAALAADNFGFEAESEESVAEQARGTSPPGGRRKHPLIDLSNAPPGTLVTRPPIVAVLGACGPRHRSVNGPLAYSVTVSTPSSRIRSSISSTL